MTETVLRDLFGDLLGGLEPDRYAHSIAVGMALVEVAGEAPARHRADLVAAGVLHDVGYSPEVVDTGFHPVDGAAHLSAAGFSPVVCDLVATHTIATREAVERGLAWDSFAPFVLVGHQDVERLRQLVTWADLTTGPTGRRVAVHERLDGILARYSSETPVHRYVVKHRQLLTRLGNRPIAAGDAVEPLVIAP